MPPKPFDMLFIKPMLDLEQALSFEFYYRPKGGMRQAYGEPKNIKPAVNSQDENNPTALSQHV